MYVYVCDVMCMFHWMATVLAPVCSTMSAGFPLNSFMTSNCTRCLRARKWWKRESKFNCFIMARNWIEERRRYFLSPLKLRRKNFYFSFFAICRDRKSSYLFKWHEWRRRRLSLPSPCMSYVHYAATLNVLLRNCIFIHLQQRRKQSR